jgi:ABC-type antimicrobial peptide transport system ATPase subunit
LVTLKGEVEWQYQRERVEEAVQTLRCVRRRRVRIFAESISISYLYLNTPELDAPTEIGVAAVQSIPLTSSRGRFWACSPLIVVNRRARRTSTQRRWLAVRVADRFEQLE